MGNVRNRFSPRVSQAIEFDGPGRTKQSMKAECDINNIVNKYRRTGTIAHLAKHGGQYGFASAMDFRESMDIVLKAKAMFADLPSVLRKRFGNDPAGFLEYVQDKNNLEEMRKLGLALPAAPEPPAAPVAPPA